MRIMGWKWRMTVTKQDLVPDINSCIIRWMRKNEEVEKEEKEEEEEEEEGEEEGEKEEEKKKQRKK